MHKPDVELVKLGSLESRMRRLTQSIAAQEFHVVGIGARHSAVLPGESSSRPLPASLAGAITALNDTLAVPDDPENVELLKVGQDADELKRARALAQFAATMQIAIETDHGSRHAETQEFYKNCVKQILEDPNIKAGGKYHDEFREVFRDSLEEERRKLISLDHIKIIHNTEQVFANFATLETHLKQHIPDLDDTEVTAKHFLLTSAKQMFLCRSEKELDQCAADFKFALKHSGLTEPQQRQLTADMDNYHGNYKKIFQADQRQLKLVGAAVLHVAALGTDVTKSLVSSGVLNSDLLKFDSDLLKYGAMGAGMGMGVAAGKLEEMRYSNIVDTPAMVAGRQRALADTLAPYLLDNGTTLKQRAKDAALNAFQEKVTAIKEKPREKIGLAATVVGFAALAVPPLAPVLLPTAACLAITSAAMARGEALADTWSKSEIIALECDSSKASYERAHHYLMEDHGTDAEIEANREREATYLASRKPDLELDDLAAVSEVSSEPVSPAERCSAYKERMHSVVDHPKPPVKEGPREDLSDDSERRPH